MAILPAKYFPLYVAFEGFVLFVLMEILIHPRPTKPVGRLFKLLLEITCLLAALLPSHYYYGGYYCSRGFEPDDDATVCRNYLFGLVVVASFQVYAVFFAFRCSPDVGVLDALFVLSMQNLVHWVPAAADHSSIISALAILCCALLIALRYHRSPAYPDYKYKEIKVDEESLSVSLIVE